MKQISLNTLVQQEDFVPVFIVNTTSGAERGEVFFTVPNSTGTKEDQVRVPNTMIPVCLTDQVTRRQLLDSSAFRRAVSIRTLTLVDPEDAQAALVDPENAAEIERVRQNLAATTVTDVQEGLGESIETRAAMPAPVLSFIELMETKGQDELALASLKTLGELTTNEYKAVYHKAQSISFVKTAEYARSKGLKT